MEKHPPLSFATALLLLTFCSPARVFLFGSILQWDNSSAYRALTASLNKTTSSFCDFNWQTTPCPKVAVITSACPDSACGEEEYYVGDEEEAATGPFFQ